MDPRIEAAETAIREGRRDAAIAGLTALIGEDPTQPPEVWMSLARQLHAAGRYPEGEAITAQAVTGHPESYPLWNLHGVMLQRLRRGEAALAALDRAIAISPEETGARVNRGSVLLDLGRTGEARDLFADLAVREPQNPLHLAQLGRAKARLGEAPAAEGHLRQALALKPDFAEAWLQLAALAEADPARAEAILTEGLAACPDHPKLLEAKALVLRASGQRTRAQAFLEGLEPRMPDAAWVQFHLGDLVAEGDAARGRSHLRRAVALAPGALDHQVALIQSLERPSGDGGGDDEGVALDDEGVALDEAWGLGVTAMGLGGLTAGHRKVLRDVFTRVCDFAAAEDLGDFRTLGRAWAAGGLHTALLKQIGRVRTDEDRRELLEQHRIWGRAVEARAERSPIRRPAPRPVGPRIRLGLMSSDLRRHPVSAFALPLFDHRDPRFEVICYSFFRGAEDPLQASIAARASGFRWLPEATAREAAQVIADDDLDMLIELGGSTQMNRLEAMAWRPAPRQASWLGYPHSTGLEAIDHFICDPYSTPADPTLLAETPLVLPSTWIAFAEAVFETYPPVAAGLPEDRAGAFTFGTANAPHKYSAQVLGAWARITAAVPGARFAFIRPEAGSAVFRANVAAAFAAEGVPAERLLFRAVRGDHMRRYDEVDVSLDAFPLTGGTTTAEALWMGVPVVSLRGPAFYERLSSSILTNAGLGDLVADDLEGFAATALALAADKPRRAALRAGLRDQIRQGPLGRTQDFARDFYGAIAQLVGS